MFREHTLHITLACLDAQSDAHPAGGQVAGFIPSRSGNILLTVKLPFTTAADNNFDMFFICQRK